MAAGGAVSLEALMTQPATVTRPGVQTDGYGNTKPDWTAGTATALLVWITQRSADWQREHRDAELSDWIGYFPADTDIRQGDRVLWYGTTFTVRGRPLPAHRPGTGVHHIEAQLDLVEG